MAAIITRRLWNRQPTGALDVAWSNPLAAGIGALFCGSDPSIELVWRTQFNIVGAPYISDSGAALVANSSGTGTLWRAPDYASGGPSDVRYDPVAPPVTLFMLGSAAGNYGPGIARPNGSQNPSFGIDLYHGGADRAVGFYNLTSSALVNGNTVPSVATGLHAAVFVIGASTYALYCDSLSNKLTGNTGGGNFTYQYTSADRALSLGGSSKFVASGTIAMAGAVYGYAWGDAEVGEFLNNPWQLFRPRTRRLYFGAAAGGNTASVPSGSLSLAGLAPTVSATANQTATVPAAALTLTGLVPTISATANQTVTIPAASLALTGLAPTVSVTANEAVTVPAASLALSGNAPTVSATQNQTASIPAGSLTLTGEIPTVTATQNQLLAVPLGSLALTGNIPAIQVGGTQTLDVPLGTLALIGNAPTVTATDNQTVGVPLGALSLAALAPSIASSANQRIMVPLAALTMTGLLPAITATQNQFVVVPVGTFTMVIYAPVLSGPLVRAPVIPKWLQLWYRADVRKQTLFLRSDVTGKQGFARSDVTENEGVVLTKSDDASVQ